MCDDDIGGAGGPRYLVMTNPPGDRRRAGRPSASRLADRPSSQTGQRGGPGHHCPRIAAVARLAGDVDDAFHAERGVLAVVLGVKEAGQRPDAGPAVDDLLFSALTGRAFKKVVKVADRC